MAIVKSGISDSPLSRGGRWQIADDCLPKTKEENERNRRRVGEVLYMIYYNQALRDEEAARAAAAQNE